MRTVALLLLLLLLPGGMSAQIGVRPDTDSPIPFEPILPEYPADALAKIGGSERIDLFLEVDFRGFVLNVEAFGPWMTCGKIDPVAEALQKAAIDAVKQTTFYPGLRLGKPADAPLVLTLEVRGAKLPSPAVKAESIKGGVIKGRATSLPKPKYPKTAKKYRLEGSVKIAVLVNEEGNVVSARAESGHPLLLGPSALAACEARFDPTLLGGTPVKVSGFITYNFVR